MMQRQVKSIQPSSPQSMMPNLDRASRLLQDLPALRNHPGVTPAQQRGLAREVFQEVRLREGRLVAVRPRPRYAPFFAYALWRQHVAGGARSSWVEQTPPASTLLSGIGVLSISIWLEPISKVA